MKQYLLFNSKKIFFSKLNLEYLDQSFENSYQTYNFQTKAENTNLFLKILVIISLFLSISIICLDITRKEKNITWNGVLSVSNLFLAVSIFFLKKHYFIKKEGHALFFLNLMIHIGYENIFISLICIAIVDFKMGVETVSFILLFLVLTRSLISIALHEGFIFSLSKVIIIFLLKIILLSIFHYIWLIIFYLVLDFFIYVLNLAITYTYEYLTRKFIYSLFRLQKDKDDFLETIEFLNISYFSLKNSKIKNPINMRKFSRNCLEEELNGLQIVEEIFNHLVEFEKMPMNI